MRRRNGERRSSEPYLDTVTFRIRTSPETTDAMCTVISHNGAMTLSLRASCSRILCPPLHVATRPVHMHHEPTAATRLKASAPMPMNNLHNVLVDMIKDLYHAEKQLMRALPKLAKAATSKQLRMAFESHLVETEGHVDRLEQVFAALEMKPVAKVCHGMMGLIEEGKEVIEEKPDSHPAAIDAALIAAAQKAEHYEISTYGTLITFAETLEFDDVASLLKKSLIEELAADKKLCELAKGSINPAAAQADSMGDEGHMKEKVAMNGGRGKRR